MKHLLLIYIILLTANCCFAQNTYTVDNKSQAIADFSSLQVAIDSVPAGSTLLVQGSTSSYGNLNIEKYIIIKGTGYFLLENPDVQAEILSSKVSTINFRQGASGTIISGLDCSSSLIINDAEPNISIINNRMRFLFSSSDGTAPNTIVIGNFIYDSINHSSACSSCSVEVGDGSYIASNYIHTRAQGTNLTLINNVMSTYAVTYSSLKNNILRGISALPDITSASNTNNFQNNVFYHSSVVNNSSDTNDNILSNQNPFIDSSDPRYSSDGQYILNDTSAAKNAGINGVDCGMFGGVYRLSGLPDIPNVYEFEVPITGYNNSSGLQVNIKVKSNN